MFANSDNGGGTDWAQKSVTQMWSMLAAHDGTAHKNLLVTWKQSADLLVDHLSRVRRYRDNLADSWHPEKSKAAAAYLDRLDDLIKHLTETYHATVENHRALGAATSALVGARLKIEAIHREYAANQLDLDAYAARQHNYQKKISKFGGPAPTPPTAITSRQLTLQLQAQSIMSTLSTDLAEAQLAITTPKIYDPIDQTDTSQPFPPKKAGGPSRFRSGKRSIAQATSSRSESFPDSNSTALADSTTPKSGVSTPQDPFGDTKRPTRSDLEPPGPILSGITFPTTPTAPPAQNTAIPATGTGDPIDGIFPVPPAKDMSPMEKRATARLPAISPIESPGATSRSTQTAFPGGGLIGSPSKAGTTSPAGSRRMQRINPTGGIIGGQPGSFPSSSRTARRSSSDDREAPTSHWDPDDPWVTDEGISPILLPPPKQDIDPGPAIGLT